ncbi:oligoribonuclease-like isoform X2 [Mangifera indica]|uniref:oligoribonuclease-like isoform X2 n=1 Tax=Mangifera indica TaxID=29780 RepID=UPI001CF93C27|nr:oligoribonuclease-like isoform X2 [Mangifera indica]
METLTNIFSVLQLDAEDDQLQSPSPSSTSRNSGQTKQKEKSCSDAKLVKIEKKNKENSVNRLEYKMPLVWIDLEMTGLNIEVDRILEIACIITDGKLTKSVEGPDLVIHQSKECLDSMGEWCHSHHKASGLTQKVLLSTLSEREAEEQVCDNFVKCSVKALCVRWYPRENRKAPSKENKHRALDDIRESIAELKYYKESIFRSKSKK